MYTVTKSATEHSDTFRELVDLWQEAGYCQVILSPDKYCWFGDVGSVLLFDWDRYDHLPESWELGLFGNPAPMLPNSSVWTYFPRRPRLLEEQIQNGYLSYSERSISSVFLGRIENHVQQNARHSVSTNWEDHIELFSCPVVIGEQFRYPFTQEEYLSKVAQSRFGLSLPGYGPKCCREIELLGLGTVPLVTPGVDTENYFEPLREGIHFLRVNSPDEIPTVIASCTPANWEYLSRNGRAWYERNASPKGSWQRTLEIIRTLRPESLH